MLCIRLVYLVAKGKKARNFNLDLTKFIKGNEKRALTIFRKIAIDLDRMVVLATPVDTGRARGNWYPSIGKPSSEVSYDKERYNKKGITAINRAAESVNTAKLGSTVWLTNNLPYIIKLENGGSKQARRGMVDISIQRIQAQFGGSIRR